MLSCHCDWEPEDPGDWWYAWRDDDFRSYKGKRRKRCCSCKKLINIGDDCLLFARVRMPYTDIEERISGDEIPMPPYFLCESCGEIYLNLADIGYCLDIQQPMEDHLAEYHEMTGFKRGNENAASADVQTTIARNVSKPKATHVGG